MFGALDTSTSGLVTQRTRLNAIAANLANANTITHDGVTNEPFRRRIPILSPSDPTTGSPDGVHVRGIAYDKAPLRLKYEPGSPFADREGYVKYPNVDPIVEQVNAIEASRSYEATISAAEATKRMMQVSLDLLS